MIPLLSSLRTVKVESVIHVQFTRGQSPVRVVDAWYTMDGLLITELESSLRTVKVESAIHVQFTRGGQGIDPSPVRVVDAWYTLDGLLIAELDPCAGTVPEGM